MKWAKIRSRKFYLDELDEVFSPMGNISDPLSLFPHQKRAESPASPSLSEGPL